MKTSPISSGHNNCLLIVMVQRLLPLIKYESLVKLCVSWSIKTEKSVHWCNSMRQRDCCNTSNNIPKTSKPDGWDLIRDTHCSVLTADKGIVFCSCMRRRPHQTKQNEAALKFSSVVGMVEYTRNSAMLSCPTVSAAMNRHTKAEHFAYALFITLYDSLVSTTTYCLHISIYLSRYNIIWKCLFHTLEKYNSHTTR